MSQDHTHQPGRKPAVPPLWAEPSVASSPFFAIPIPPTKSDIVPFSQMPETTPQQPRPGSPQPGPITHQQVAQGPGQQPQTPKQGQGLAAPNPARLQRLCRRLRQTHRCPSGGCVLSRARQDDTLGQFPDIR